MGSSVLEFQSVGGHGCNREAKVGERVIGCGKMGCPDCEARRAVTALMIAGVGSFERARFVHWPGQPDEVVDEFSWNASLRCVEVVRRKRDFLGNEEKAP